MITLTDARRRILAGLTALPGEPVALAQGAGRVLAESVVAARALPPFAASAMDGFVVAPGPAGRRLPIIDEARAGHPARRALHPSGAIRISTGAALPDGASGVIPLERVDESDGSVVLLDPVADGAHVRRAGEERAQGQPVLAAGTRLGAVELGLAAAAGSGELRCVRTPRVAVVITGDELVTAGRAGRAGQIADSNGPMLVAAAREVGAVAHAGPPVPDRQVTLRTRLAEALERADLVLVSGGVSVGRHDHVKSALAELGVCEEFWRVALRPGKPTWFGRREDRLVFGLPGNPVSALVCFWLFAGPAVRALAGGAPLPSREAAVLAASARVAADREQAVRVRLQDVGRPLPLAHSTGPQGSHRLTSLLGADALAFIPPATEPLAAGERVEVELLSALAGPGRQPVGADGAPGSTLLRE